MILRILKTLILAIPALFAQTARSAPATGGEPVCVVKDGVSLRKGPGPKFAVSWAVPKYMPLFKVDQKNGWLKVQDLEGQAHWVLASAVSKKVTCAVVRTKHAKLRQGPGTDQPLAEIPTADKYTAFLKVDRDGEWVQVKDDFDGVSWVHETNIWIPVIRTSVTF